ncbi:MAG: MaoC/PaaZ C-terminal domain-containing protein [Candidatus Hydrogenedentes bacterium]|nr:MaoC/PaaZ C-terminal domain-containing protein [Candidatus Hydrogenedentota bacterium]
MEKVIKIENLPSPYSIFLLMINKTRFENILSQPKVKVTLDNLIISKEWVNRYNIFFNLLQENKVPITFPFLATMPLQLKLFSITETMINPLGFLHISNYMKKFKEIPLEKSLSSEVLLKRVELVKKGVEICVEITILSQGEILWQCESKYLKFSNKYRCKEETIEKSRIPTLPIDNPNREITFTVTSRDAKNYASLSKDYNPIHISKLFAKLMKLPSPIIHGMWTVGKTLQHLSYSQAENVYFYHIFKGPIPIGSTGKILVQPIDNGEKVEVYIEGNPKPCLQGLISATEIEN